MFDTIILLTGPAEHSVFTSLLRGYNPRLTVVPVFTLEDLMAIEEDWLNRARLIAFTTTVIVPAEVLHRLGYGAYNFHPGPPQYPGRAPAHLALHERQLNFGATVHRMIERVDSGPIVEVESFAIPADSSVAGLEELTYTRLVGMFWRMAKQLATLQAPLAESGVQWAVKRNSRHGHQQIRNNGVASPKTEQQHRVRVFGADHFGIVPSTNPHGFQFRAVLPETEIASA